MKNKNKIKNNNNNKLIKFERKKFLCKLYLFKGHKMFLIKKIVFFFFFL